MQKTDKFIKCKQEDIHRYVFTSDVKSYCRKEKQKSWWMLTESVLAGIAWNG